MITHAPNYGVRLPSQTLSVSAAVRRAWQIYFLLLAVPFILVLGLVWRLTEDPAPIPATRNSFWFVAAMAFMAVVIPLSFFARERFFRVYWLGKPIAPAKYLLGMTCVWLALDASAIFTITGSIVTGSLMPNLIPAVLLLLFFFTQWPLGRAMVRSEGDDPDPAKYLEPR